MKSLIYLITALIMMSAVQAVPIEWKDTAKTSIILGDNRISIDGVKFTCQNQPDLTTPKYKIRTAPQGNYLQSCECIQHYVDPDYNGACFKDACTVTLDEKENDACWIASVNNNDLQYNTPKQLFPYVTGIYTTNAELKYLGTTETPSIKDYTVNFNLDVDVKNGIKSNIKIDQITAQDTEITINYENNIVDNLDGGYVVKQKTYLFLPASTLEEVPVKFKKTYGSVVIKSNKILGDKTILITPYINLKQIDDKGSILRTFRVGGAETSVKTKAVIQRDITGTEPYFPEDATITDKAGNFLSGIKTWIEGLFI